MLVTIIIGSQCVLMGLCVLRMLECPSPTVIGGGVVLLSMNVVGLVLCIGHCLRRSPPAAPASDLLGALKECVTDEGSYAYESNDPLAMRRRLKAINDVVEGAIKKAAKQIEAA